MAENFNAIVQRKQDIENAIAIIADCIEMFRPLKENKAELEKIIKNIEALEVDMDTMEKSWPQYKSSEANALKASNLLTLRCRWEELLPGKNKLENEVKILVQNTDEYLLYSESFTYIDDELLNWLLVKATEDSVKDVEFFAIILIIKNGYIGNNYESIAKNYAYKAKNQYIIEQLMNYNIDTLCDYIACQKF